MNVNEGVKTSASRQERRFTPTNDAIGNVDAGMPVTFDEFTGGGAGMFLKFERLSDLPRGAAAPDVGHVYRMRYVFAKEYVSLGFHFAMWDDPVSQSLEGRAAGAR